jgi:hypothetical protein
MSWRKPKKEERQASLLRTVVGDQCDKDTAYWITSWRVIAAGVGSGPGRLRRAIWLAAVNAIRRDAQLGKMYHTQLARGKHALVAVGAVARKLTHLIYYLCLHNRPYDPGYWEQSQLAPPPEYAVA